MSRKDNQAVWKMSVGAHPSEVIMTLLMMINVSNPDVQKEETVPGTEFPKN